MAMVNGYWKVCRWLACLLAGAWMMAASGATASGMQELAVMAVQAGGIAKASVRGSDAVAVAFSEQGGCKMVGAWFESHQRGLVNFKVCGSRATAEGSVAKLPKSPESAKLVREVLKSAVLKGDASRELEEFTIRAKRLPAQKGGLSCLTELVITSDGLLSFFGVQNACL